MSCQRARDSLVAGVLLLPHATLQTWRADHSSCQPRMHALCVLLLLLCVVVCSRESLVAITCQQTPGPARALARTTPAASPAAKFRRKSSETPPSSPRLPHPARLEQPYTVSTWSHFTGGFSTNQVFFSVVYQNCKCASVVLAQNSFPFSPPSLSCCLERVCGRASLQRPRAPRRVCSLPGCRGGPIPTPPSRTLRTPSTNAANGPVHCYAVASHEVASSGRHVSPFTSLVLLTCCSRLCGLQTLSSLPLIQTETSSTWVLILCNQ